MKKIKQPLLLSTLCLSLITAGAHASTSHQALSPNSAEQQIGQISYDTILGENGAFIDLDTDEFVLNQKEWFQIQTYVEGALSLPITEASMKSAFDIADDVPFSNFKALMEQYGKVHAEAFYWKEDLYPDIVDLALSLSNYNDIQKYMIDPLSDQLTVILTKSISPLPADVQAVEQARQLSIAYLSALKNFSVNNQQKVEKASEDLLTFATKIEEQKLQLDVLKSTHSGYLEDDGSALQQRVNDLNNRIDQLNKDYDHYVTVAATAVTYAWFPAVAVPIMGVYGDKAEKARKLRNQLQDEAKVLEAQLSTTQKIYNSYSRSTESINIISSKIENAIPYVNKLKLHWQKMNTDFDSLIVALEAAESNTEILQSNAVLAAAGAMANTAVAEQNWNSISEKAKTFANNAYIQKAE
ncbi:alpha-xenorhabdolysin family binary toxin subunit A [Vibrio neptunius]|uniref:Alpha-xenorhabdolysin family binary toxin subunit A n=1 Tax=Vibrio neptunius TaxID=170651 RepID=A0ABS3A4Z4_9VIBR|nr:alpha-xenorhabdolysin family binary toxin subunit A [Vibrio neptunius]MBN3494147.1 alpha-xenorhabdolysin family binary toxin subunit A [Vibrio neptunius]MBN3516857.1 alpha-xenorhabdolysin family binary toxin subunit A [Vibrio neptunius]MBN3550818.1 alpha-xenorhabdolysin family binary toxin subunit A [Vibrio neptunius]MBN3578949.1 alpha-xenorhabdolysin family binary toxin subunit A [Vibrio neptunius]MCH9872614.1 alpha-xenorhabdolysin family binary toxin subunit A [Vibrio neptunius]